MIFTYALIKIIQLYYTYTQYISIWYVYKYK